MIPRTFPCYPDEIENLLFQCSGSGWSVHTSAYCISVIRQVLVGRMIIVNIVDMQSEILYECPYHRFFPILVGVSLCCYMNAKDICYLTCEWLFYPKC
jgi:hypothetical protein